LEEITLLQVTLPEEKPFDQLQWFAITNKLTTRSSATA